MTGRSAALWSIPAIGAALGVLGIVHAMGPDREAIRAELAAEIAKVEALPADDPARKDRRINELMAVEDYRVHARALWLKLERMHGPAQQAARLDEEARKRVQPFLVRGAGDLPADVDECRALLDSYGGTRFGPALRERQQQLSAALEAAKLKSGPSVAEILVTANRERLKGCFGEALRMVDQALRTLTPNDEALPKFRSLRAEILQSSKTRGEKLLAQAAADRNPEPLEKALPDFSGVPEAARFEALIRQLRGR